MLHVLKDHDEGVPVATHPIELDNVLVLQVGEQLRLPLEVLPGRQGRVLQGLRTAAVLSTERGQGPTCSPRGRDVVRVTETLPVPTGSHCNRGLETTRLRPHSRLLQHFPPLPPHPSQGRRITWLPRPEASSEVGASGRGRGGRWGPSQRPLPMGFPPRKGPPAESNRGKATTRCFNLVKSPCPEPPEVGQTSRRRPLPFPSLDSRCGRSVPIWREARSLSCAGGPRVLLAGWKEGAGGARDCSPGAGQDDGVGIWRPLKPHHAAPARGESSRRKHRGARATAGSAAGVDFPAAEGGGRAKRKMGSTSGEA